MTCCRISSNMRSASVVCSSSSTSGGVCLASSLSSLAHYSPTSSETADMRQPALTEELKAALIAGIEVEAAGRTPSELAADRDCRAAAEDRSAAAQIITAPAETETVKFCGGRDFHLGVGTDTNGCNCRSRPN